MSLRRRIKFIINSGFWIAFFIIFSDPAISDSGGSPKYTGEGFTPDGMPVSEIICIERETAIYGEGDNDRVCIDADRCFQGNTSRECIGRFPCFVCISDNGCINETNKSGSQEIRFRKNGTLTWKTEFKTLMGDHMIVDGRFVSKTYAGQVTLLLTDATFPHDMFVFDFDKRFTPLSVNVTPGVAVTYWQCTWQ